MAALKTWPHQDKTIIFCRSRPRVLDTSDPGTGKTRGHIEAFLNTPNRKRMLVVCPKTLMEAAWGEDIAKFGVGLTVSYAKSGHRKAAFDMPTDVVIINSDGVKELMSKDYAPILKQFSTLVIDEFTSFKNGSAQRTKAMMKLRAFFTHRRLLSGTPTPKSVMELWAPMMILDDGARLGNSYYKLRNSVQTPVQVGPSASMVRWDDKPGAVQAVQSLISDITIRHAFEDVMKHVPPNHKEIKTFTLSKKAQAHYDLMKRDSILALQAGNVTAVHAASMRTKLLQIASGAVYTGLGDGDYEIIDRQRYELIADMVEERPHSVTFFNWKHQRDVLSETFDKRKISYCVIDGSVKDADRLAIVKRYQAGEYQTLLLHPRTGAHGLTLDRGTTTIISSPNYEADLLNQGIHRIYRGAQTQKTNTIMVEAAKTVERLVYQRLDEKYAQMVDLLDLLQT